MSSILLFIDFEASPDVKLRTALVSCVDEIHWIADLDQVAAGLFNHSPNLIAFRDPGGDQEAALAQLVQVKANGPNRQVMIFSERHDQPWAVQAVERSAADHVLPLDISEETLRPLIASAVRTSQKMQELISANHTLTKSSKTDALTGLYNHGHIMEWLRIEHKRAHRDLDPLCAVMVDLDYFKFINDTYGHHFGDFVLRETAGVLRQSLRESDIIGRYGGEEFLILAPKTDAIGGRQIADKLRREIEAHNYRDDVFDVRLTASFGLATSEHSAATTPELLLQLADKALYEAKEAGRNRVYMAKGDVSSHSSAVRTEIDSIVEGGEMSTAVMVVDPNPAMRAMLAEQVQEIGHRAICATTGEEVLEKMKAQTPVCVLLETQLPDMDGFTLCRKIRSVFRDTHVPVIFVTAQTALNSQMQAYESGADDFLVKPIVREHLAAKIQAQVRTKQLHDRLKVANSKIKKAQRTIMRAERLKAVGQLAGGMAHDFNNVLSSILGHTQRMQMGTKTGANPQQSLNAIEKIIDQGSETIRRLLFFTRDEEKTTSVSRELQLADVIQDCLQITRTRWKDEADRFGITYNIESELDQDLKIVGNPTDLREVFTAVIFNAFDAMPEGGDLNIRLSRVGNAEALIEISDSGEGMSAEVLAKVFDPFYTTKPGSGSGLGLSIAYGVVNRMSGRIECESEVGKGTTFRIHLPCVGTTQEILSVPVAAQKEPVTMSPKSDETKPSHRILIIDDEPHIREVFTEILRDEGYEVTSASDGESGLEILENSPQDLVITDLGMPGMSGWEVAKAVRQMARDTKIVLTSGWGDDIESEAPEPGLIDRSLPKPVSLRELLACVSDLLNGKDAAVTASQG